MDQPTHRDIISRMETVERALEAVERSLEARHAAADRFREETAHSMGTIATTLRVIGEQVERIEDKVLTYDTWKERAIGAVTIAGIALGVIWWMTKDALAKVFGVAP